MLQIWITEKELTKEDKKKNQELESERVVNENVIGILKRFKIIADNKAWMALVLLIEPIDEKFAIFPEKCSGFSGAV